MGILKRVVAGPAIYPRFIEFLHLDIQSTGRTMSRPWSRQPNDVMSEIECAQLHSELFSRRHSTRQSHGRFALVKHLFDILCSQGFRDAQSHALRHSLTDGQTRMQYASGTVFQRRRRHTKKERRKMARVV